MYVTFLLWIVIYQLSLILSVYILYVDGVHRMYYVVDCAFTSIRGILLCH